MEKAHPVESLSVKKGYSAKQIMKFLIPSIIGVLLFLVPISVDGTVTIGLGVMADALQAAIAEYSSNHDGGYRLISNRECTCKSCTDQGGAKQFLFDGII